MFSTSRSPNLSSSSSLRWAFSSSMPFSSALLVLNKRLLMIEYHQWTNTNLAWGWRCDRTRGRSPKNTRFCCTSHLIVCDHWGLPHGLGPCLLILVCHCRQLPAPWQYLPLAVLLIPFIQSELSILLVSEWGLSIWSPLSIDPRSHQHTHCHQLLPTLVVVTAFLFSFLSLILHLPIHQLEYYLTFKCQLYVNLQLTKGYLKEMFDFLRVFILPKNVKWILYNQPKNEFVTKYQSM